MFDPLQTTITYSWACLPSLNDTAGETYLSQFGKIPSHDCVRYDAASHEVVALFQSLETGRGCALGRISLGNNGFRLSGKLIGDHRGAACYLSSKIAVYDHLSIAVGLENAIAAKEFIGLPTWCLASNEVLANFPVLPRVTNLYIGISLADKGASQKAAEAVSDRYRARGRVVHALAPDEFCHLSEMRRAA